ncbi:MAG: hypothetical protein MJZ23_09500 [Paludibacteraceae bacterium]|nr:hypothetical protein [Paludibacteraceae bacterium]
MAENEVSSLQNLDEKVEKLIQLCSKYKEERDEAYNRIGELKAELVNAEVKVKQLEQKNRTLQSMQIGDVSIADAKRNRTQLLKLVREIDKCIALLNK